MGPFAVTDGAEFGFLLPPQNPFIRPPCGWPLILQAAENGVLIKSFDFLTERDVGLDGKAADRLKGLVVEHKPDLLILDPLRFAAPKGDSKEENWGISIVDQVSLTLPAQNVSLAK